MTKKTQCLKIFLSFIRTGNFFLVHIRKVESKEAKPGGSKTFNTKQISQTDFLALSVFISGISLKPISLTQDL